MTKPNELKACPFCDQNLWREGFGWTHNTEKDCPLNGMAFIDGSRGLAAWNTRTVPMQSEVVETLKFCETRLQDMVSAIEANAISSFNIQNDDGETWQFHDEWKSWACSALARIKALSSLPQPLQNGELSGLAQTNNEALESIRQLLHDEDRTPEEVLAKVNRAVEHNNKFTGERNDH